MELGIPVVMAVNMMDLVNKSGDKINLDKLKEKMGCAAVVEISALKGTGIQKAAEAAVVAANVGTAAKVHKFNTKVENVLESIEDKLGSDVPEEQKRFFAIKLLERDDKIAQQMKKVPDVSAEITSIEKMCIRDRSYITAVPRMSYYMKYSTQIYDIYLKYVAPEDVHIYSVDEVFIDATAYLKTYQMSARDLALRMIRNVMEETGIVATAGIGTNLYLCKVAMDIVAKKISADKDGVRIAQLDERSYREQLLSLIHIY